MKSPKVKIQVSESVQKFNRAIKHFDEWTNHIYEHETDLKEIARICNAIVCPKLAHTIMEGGKL